MQIKVYQGFTKKKNSTAQPASTIGETKTVRLKAGTSITNPVFIMDSVGVNMNYVYVSDWGRYYYVTDAVQINNELVELSCSVDVLASAKSYIGSTNAFVERSSAANNAWISDGEVIPTDEIVQTASKDTPISGAWWSRDNIVARVVGAGGAKNFLVTRSMMNQFFSSFFNVAQHFSSVEEAVESLFNAVSQPAQYVASLKWFPFLIDTSGSDTMALGFTVGANPVPVADSIGDGTCTLDKPARYYNDWRDFDPRFTQASLFVPGYGDMDIDPKYLESTITLHYCTDINTGACSITIKAGNKYIATLSINAACDVPIGGLGGTGAAPGIAQMIGSISPDPARFLQGVAGGFANAVEGSLTPSMSTSPSSGNMEFWYNESNAVLSVTRLGSTGRANTVLGLPLKEYRQLSTLGGYILCKNASVSCPFTAPEKESINSYVNSGFYYE